MQRVSELFNVNSFIVSQTNPFAIPFLDHDDGGGMTGSKKISFWKLLKNLIGSEIKLRVSQVIILMISKMFSFGIIPTNLGRCLKLFTQDFRGNVTIFPVPVNLLEFSKLVSNPTKESIKKCKVYGGRKTYPKICRIENLVKIENAIDKYYRKIKTKVNNLYKEKIMKIDKIEESIFAELDGDNKSENDDFENISEKQNRFIILQENIKVPESEGIFIHSKKAIYHDINNKNTNFLTRDDSFNIPTRNLSCLNINTSK